MLLPAILLLFSHPVSAEQDWGLPPLKESNAYQQFKVRPISDFSKLIYLVDRFGSLKIQIKYDGNYFSALFAGRIARWFLQRNYKDEPPHDWIMKWCNQSVPAGNLIWAKMPDGKFRLAREVLLEEMDALEKAMAEDGLRLPENHLSAAVATAIPSPAKTNQPQRFTA
jgi:hypothetical protein